MEELVPFGSAAYFSLLTVLVAARGSDFLSTWMATPNLVLEANPIAKRIGWRFGLVFNLGMCVAVAVWPLPSIVIATTSFLVAARNFQSAWLMRCLGEEGYRCWIGARMRETRLGFYLFCLAAQTVLVTSLGVALIYYSPCSVEPTLLHLVPFAIGVGIVTYAMAVLFYTLLSLWRVRG
jgi:hypothetical protein